MSLYKIWIRFSVYLNVINLFKKMLLYTYKSRILRLKMTFKCWLNPSSLVSFVSATTTTLIYIAPEVFFKLFTLICHEIILRRSHYDLNEIRYWAWINLNSMLEPSDLIWKWETESDWLFLKHGKNGILWDCLINLDVYDSSNYFKAAF